MAIDRATQAIMDRIKAMLANQLTSDPAFPANPLVSLASPDEADPNAELVLFLYLITPDPELRNRERIVPSPDPWQPQRKIEPAVPVELRFLVTTGKKAPAGPAGLDRLAAAILAIESGSPLNIAGLLPSPLWLSLLPLSSDEMSRIWGLFPNENCRTCFAFRAGPVWIEARDPVPLPLPVNDDRFGAGVLPAAAGAP